MPNWCQNRIVVQHENSAQISELVNVIENSEGLFNSIIPMPKEIYQSTILSQEVGHFASQNMPSWYDWSVKNWGTKWDADNILIDAKDNNRLTLFFQTAWSPPIPICIHMLEKDFQVSLHYVEYGMNFGGYFKGQGSTIEERFFDDLAKCIPGELEDIFGLSECLDYLNCSVTKH